MSTTTATTAAAGDQLMGHRAVEELLHPAAMKGIVDRYGAAGAEFIETLPARVATIAREQQLTIEGPLSGGALSAVLAVRTVAGEPAVLKVHPSPVTLREERETLRAWQQTAQSAAAGAGASASGVGSPSLLAELSAYGAVLMDRLTPGTTLRKSDWPGLAQGDASGRAGIRAEAEALAPLFAVIAGTPAAADLEPGESRVRAAMGRVLAAAARHPELEQRVVGLTWVDDLASGRSAVPTASTRSRVWCHGDLHPGNVLATGSHRWAMIDPMPCAAELASDVAFLATSRFSGAHTADTVEGYAHATGADASRVAWYAQVWAADRLRVAVMHGFFTPHEWDLLASVARSGPAT